ncbi:uncharacterized protein LOC125940047 [Dermacentor silvarum]|uniref:uncharacterized protein LOC125940047 n=1 Tax=Dermacentor silvarum TaxID=543639 RepID=UPI0021018B28|nr:uncharacterized protein LOC125940047 [Dermacentor silvarum]
MSSFVIAICMLFALSAVTKGDPDTYAEDPKNFERQHLLDFTRQPQTFFVVKRDYKTETEHRCLSAKQVKEFENGTYEYQLSARVAGSSVSYTVPVDPMKTGAHTEPNAAYYEEAPNEGRLIHRIMTTNGEHTCFVITVPVGNIHGCFILVREDKAGKPIPNECDSVYKKECGQTSVELYDSTCK